jgi:hypothetical protein
MAELQSKEPVEKEAALTAEIERLLPDFARSCPDSADVVIIHQDSFAAAYALFGKAMKLAGRPLRVLSLRFGRRSPLETCFCDVHRLVASWAQWTVSLPLVRKSRLRVRDGTAHVRGIHRFLSLQRILPPKKLSAPCLGRDVPAVPIVRMLGRLTHRSGRSRI